MLFAGNVVFDLHAVHGFFTKNLDGFGVVQDFNVVQAVHAVLHRLGGTHDVAADEHRHLGAQLGEVAGLLACAVAGTDNHNLLVAVEKAVAHGASTHAPSDVAQPKFAFEAQPFGRRPSADDDRVRVDFRFLVVANPNLVHRSGEVHLGDPAVPHVGVKPLGLIFQVLHHLGTIDAGRVAGEVVDFGGFGELSTRLLSLVEDGFHVCAGSVDGGGVSCRTGAHNQAVYVFGSTHGLDSFGSLGQRPGSNVSQKYTSKEGGKAFLRRQMTKTCQRINATPDPRTQRRPRARRRAEAPQWIRSRASQGE